MFEIISISRVVQADPVDLMHVDCAVMINGIEETIAAHAYRENDINGLNPLIKAWLEDNPYFHIDPYVPVDPTPEETRYIMPDLSARQLRLGLLAGEIPPSQVSATIAAMPAGPDKEKAQIEWEYAATFNRMHPLIATVGAALNLSDVQIDAMWSAAVSL
ncbi:hypothetical protein [Sinorhizobium sp. GL28]|uniref:hypothetical protein n=1 Tax=Sinorhizobium sp. GL28 TaxID=1358418 RepID=UPI00071C749A|nr:hypothetical protein [Sinorhizobium sp. GL28]KSV89786.1 hypothetical protein N184_27215 [Sinorhizobium sp. GL28]